MFTFMWVNTLDFNAKTFWRAFTCSEGYCGNERAKCQWKEKQATEKSEVITSFMFEMPLTTHGKWQYIHPLHNKCLGEAATYRRSGWNVGRAEHKGKTKYWGRQLRLLILADWMVTLVRAVEGIRQRSVLEKSENTHSDVEFTPKPVQHLQGWAGTLALPS